MFDYDPVTDTTLATSTAPTRRPWAICDGGTYGGIVTPDLCHGRFPKGATGGFHTLAGAATVVLTLNQIPSHKHGIPRRTVGKTGGDGDIDVLDTDPSPGFIDSSYSGGAGTTFGGETPPDPTAAADPVNIAPLSCTVGFKKYIGFP